MTDERPPRRFRLEHGCAVVILAVALFWVLNNWVVGLASFSLYAAVCLLLYWRDRVRARRRCPSCVYDRRGLDADASCPKCSVSPTPK